MKRILSLDGGGIRGVFSLKILKRIEEIFRKEHGKPELVLRDVFDFFAGTSTGAIIAAFLAWGKSVDEIERLYLKHAKIMFSPAPLLKRHKAMYDSDPISRFFMEEFCEADGTHAQLGTRKLYANATDRLPKTYLLIVMRNASTGSTWPINNNPMAKYAVREHPECNLNIPLWKLLRASTAAPIFFPPESITLGEKSHQSTSIFMDGGITPYNNPSLIATLMAILPPYNMNWKTGPEQLQVVSVGTTQARTFFKTRDVERITRLDQLKHIVPALLHSVGLDQDRMCRVLGDCRHGESLDSEIGDLVDNVGPLAAGEKKFAYVRYNRTFKPEEVRALKTPFALDNLGLIRPMQDAGLEYAKEHVKRGHFFPEKA